MWTRLCSFVALFSLLSLSAANANSVSIEGDDPKKRITLRIEQTSVDKVLSHIGKVYGIKVSGVKRLKSREPLSLTMSGSLYSLLGRLLRNRDYLIVRSPDNKSGVERVVILTSSNGSDVKAGKSSTSKNKFSEQIKSRLSVRSQSEDD